MKVEPGSSAVDEPSSCADRCEDVRTLPILVLFPHNRCNCRCVMCDIWKIRQAREITARDLAPHLDSFRALKVRWVVLSGGEPLLHTDLAGLGRLLRAEGIRVTLLTAGLLLERFASLVAENVDDLIVSLDGPPEIHDEIRGVPDAYRRLAEGVAALRRIRPVFAVASRSTVQKKNFRHLRRTVETARKLSLDSVSFLAADVTSEAFNRPVPWSSQRQGDVALNAWEIEDLSAEVEALIQEYGSEIRSGYIMENDAKLRRIVLHFRSHLGQIPFVSPRCNAPWVSAVIEANGTVRPCFFHRPIGNLQSGRLDAIINGPDSNEFRRALDVRSNPICQKCVCPLYLPPSALGE